MPSQWHSILTISLNSSPFLQILSFIILWWGAHFPNHAGKPTRAGRVLITLSLISSQKRMQRKPLPRDDGPLARYLQEPRAVPGLKEEVRNELGPRPAHGLCDIPSPGLSFYCQSPDQFQIYSTEQPLCSFSNRVLLTGSLLFSPSSRDELGL